MPAKNTYSKINAIIVISMLIFSFCAFSIYTLNNFDRSTQESLSETSSSLDFQGRNNYPSNLLEPSTEVLSKFPSSGFIRNQGQITDDSIKYYYSANGLIVGFSPTKIKFDLLSTQDHFPNYFTISFPNAQEVSPIGVFQKNHTVNYFYEDFLQTNIPTYGEVWYYDLYPGIDMRYYISNEGLKYEFIVHPGVDPSPISLKVSPTMKLTIEDRQVSYKNSMYEELLLQDTKLRVFQSDGLEIGAKFVLKTSEQNSYGFLINSFNPDQFLTIDPLILTFSTFLGGNDYDYANDILVDAYNNTYITGKTSSLNFPVTPTSLNDTNNGGDFDIFLSKLDPTGNGLVFSTYIGGNGYDSALGLAVDLYNNTYITGKTSSSNFPITANAINDTYNGGDYDLFITKLNSTGNKIEFSTYLGGTEEDIGKSCVVDQYNNTYISGYTGSSDYPADNGYSSFSGNYDTFITKINAAGDTVIFSSLIGGSENEYSYGIAVDDYNNSYITGETWSDNFPTKNSYSDTLWGNTDSFVTKLNASGNGLVFSTFLGGSAEDYGYSIAVDSYNNTYITGKTISPNFPTYFSFSAHSGSYDAFITKLNASGSGLVYSTYLGGSGEDYGYGIAVDSFNNTYITGKTASSSNFPVTMNAFNRTFGGSYDAFITKLNTTGNGLLYCSFIGGSGEDSGESIAIDVYNNTYVAGFTRSPNFPTNNFYSSSFGGYVDVFVSKFTLDDIFPEITLESPQDNTINQSGALIDLTVTDNHLTKVLINWDEQPNQTLTDTYLITTPSGDGEHILHVYAYDEAGNVATKEYVFVTDDTAPEIALISPKNRTYPSLFLVNIFGEASHYWYNINGGTNDTWSGIVYKSLADGTYKLHAYANDSIGNLAHKTVDLTIDSSFAAVDIASPLNKTYTDSNMTIGLASASGIDAEHYWYHIEGEDDVNQSWTIDEYRVLVDGTYTLHAYGNNTAGNVTFITITFSIDTTPPALTINSPQNKTYTGNTIIIDLLGNAENYWYQIEGVDVGNQSWTAAVSRTLSNDIYILHVYGNDTVGNEAYKNVTFTVNTTLATVIIDSPINTIYSTGNITISFSGDASLYLYKIEGVDDVDRMWTTAVIRSLDDGTYTLQAYGSKIIDVNTYVNVTFTIDTIPPIITIDSPISSTIREESINVSLSGEAVDYWYYLEGVDEINHTWISSVERILTDGQYTLHAYGNDSAGNVGHDSVVFTIDTVPINTTTEPTTTSQETTFESTTTTARPGSYISFYTIILVNILLVILVRKRKKK